ncbi:hypothetical protein, partial [Acinetobacter baumannii]|uniref:hypothetical protein n=1 Tax=Acinetobacter baumannii TaxID=470 RepID=UPI003F6867C9
LERVADELGATAQTEPVRPAAGRSRPTGAITPESFAAIVAAQLPEQAIVVDEALTGGRALLPATHDAPPHDWLQLTGGAIGIG